MNIVDIIIKKRDGNELTTEELEYFVSEYTGDRLHDYQAAALLMAIYFKGLNDRETADLTLAMARSGDMADFSDIPGVKVDKHSTGGVGDTTTLVLAPLVAACGVPTVKMSGRGLGFTGGTIDKLDAIKGLNTNISIEKAKSFVRASNVVIMGQSDNLTPADGKIYALRDVTGTVDQLSLITSSIMSKKIASGADAIVLDVKCGSGAFMKDLTSAVALAQSMVKVGSHVGRKITAIISDMDEPLGMKIGNSLEVLEAIEVLKGEAEGKLKELSLLLGAQMLVLADRVSTVDEGLELLEAKIRDGSGLRKFREMIEQQGGDPDITEDTTKFPQAAHTLTVLAPRSGYIDKMDTALIGRASLETGAGRRRKNDVLDLSAGIVMNVRIGDEVNEGEPIAVLHSSNQSYLKAAKTILLQAMSISDEQPKLNPPVLAIVTDEGVDYMTGNSDS